MCREIEQRINHHARSLALGYAAASTNNSFMVMNEIGEWVRKDRNFAYFYIYDENGEIFMQIPNFENPRPLNPSMKDYKVTIRDGVMNIKVPAVYK